MDEPRSGPDLRTVFGQWGRLGDIGRAKGVFRWVNPLAHRLRDNAPLKARENIQAHYDLGNDFYSAWLDETMTYSCARFAAHGDSLEAAQLNKIATPARPARAQAGPAPARDRLRLGQPRDRGGEARREVVGLTLSREQKAWAEGKIAAAGLSPTRSKSACRIIATRRSRSTPSLRSRWSRRSASAGGAPISSASPATSARGGRAALQYIAMDHRLFDRYARSPDFIQTYIFPGGMLLDEPRFAALARERGLTGQGRDRLPPRLCRDPEALARALRRGGCARRARRLRRAVPRSLALLSDVLRGRLPRRRDRRRPGDDGQVLKTIYDRPRALTDGLAAIRTQFQLPATFPRRSRRRRRPRRASRCRPTSIAPTFRLSPSTRPARPTSTRRSRSSNRAATSPPLCDCRRWLVCR